MKKYQESESQSAIVLAKQRGVNAVSRNRPPPMSKLAAACYALLFATSGAFADCR